MAHPELEDRSRCERKVVQSKRSRRVPTTVAGIRGVCVGLDAVVREADG
jgi:hypothetical protein